MQILPRSLGYGLKVQNRGQEGAKETPRVTLNGHETPFGGQENILEPDFGGGGLTL